MSKVEMTVVFKDENTDDYTFLLTVDHIADQFGATQAKAREIVNHGVLVRRGEHNRFVSPREIIGVTWENTASPHGSSDPA